MFGWLNLKHFWGKFLFQEILLKVQESFLMVNLLPHLDNCIPIMWCEILFTFRTLGVNLDKLDDFGLLDLSFVVDIFSDIDFDFEPFWVRLGPYKLGVDELDFIESLDFF